MTKRVLLRIKGTQFTQGIAEDKAEDIEVICPGEYYYRNNTHYIRYEEVMDGEPEPVKSMIKLRDGECIVTKKGICQTQMVFENGKKSLTDYVTPFGNIMIGLDTTALMVEETEDIIRIFIKYGLEANYQFMSECTMEIEIEAKGQ